MVLRYREELDVSNPRCPSLMPAERKLRIPPRRNSTARPKQGSIQLWQSFPAFKAARTRQRRNRLPQSAAHLKPNRRHLHQQSRNKTLLGMVEEMLRLQLPPRRPRLLPRHPQRSLREAAHPHPKRRLPRRRRPQEGEALPHLSSPRTGCGVRSTWPSAAWHRVSLRSTSPEKNRRKQQRRAAHREAERRPKASPTVQGGVWGPEATALRARSCQGGGARRGGSDLCLQLEDPVLPMSQSRDLS